MKAVNSCTTLYGVPGLASLYALLYYPMALHPDIGFFTEATSDIAGRIGNHTDALS